MKGFKTFAFGALIVLISILSNAEMQTFFAEHLPKVGGLTGTAIIILRALTTSAIFKKE
jgi:hypothetical protein